MKKLKLSVETGQVQLVDLENVHEINLSLLDNAYRAIIYVGAKQNPPKAASKKGTAHRFQRVDFQRIEGTSKNALDFHIALPTHSIPWTYTLRMQGMDKSSAFVLQRRVAGPSFLATRPRSYLEDATG